MLGAIEMYLPFHSANCDAVTMKALKVARGVNSTYAVPPASRMAAEALTALPDEAPGVTAKVPLQLCSMPSVNSNATFSPWLTTLPLIRTLVAASRLSTAF